MRKIFVLILILFSNFCYSQTEQDNYEIYSLIINNTIDDWFDKPLKSILIVKKFKDKYEEDFSLINELAKDTIPDYAKNWLVRDPALQKRFSNDKTLKKAITALTMDFKNHPKIDTKRLQLNGVEIIEINSSKYYGFHRKYKNSKISGWDKIQEKYDTNLVFQLSKIKYTGKYATFYYSYHCGGLCASGNLVIMQKMNNKWKILENFELWVS